MNDDLLRTAVDSSDESDGDPQGEFNCNDLMISSTDTKCTDMLSKNEVTKMCKQKKRNLVSWTIDQKNVVRNLFKSNINEKKVPKKGECEDLKKQFPELLQNKNWLKIKVFIQNEYNKKGR